MLEIIRAPLDSPLLLTLTIAFFLVASITTLDKRLLQAVKAGTLPPDEVMLPRWVGFLIYAEWLIKIAVFVLDWRYGLLLYAVGFLLAVLPVLETVGNILMAPFRPRRRQQQQQHPPAD